jgi:phage terminase large subunit-like protein
VERARPFVSQVQVGNVYLVKAEWNKAYIQQHHNFPQTKLKDMVDASSGAFNVLTLRKISYNWYQIPLTGGIEIKPWQDNWTVPRYW